MKTLFNEHDTDDSTWKIVYMDMITMLMILFLSLWIVDRGSRNDKRKQGDVTLNKVEFQADDYFDPGKAQIKEKAREKMEALFFDRQNVFPTLGIDSRNNGRRVVLIYGHTDDQGEKRKNLELGFERAMAVYDELGKRLPHFSDNVGICSFADNFPLEKIHSVPPLASKEVMARWVDEARQKRRKNRRFEIVGQFEELDESLFRP